MLLAPKLLLLFGLLPKKEIFDLELLDKNEPCIDYKGENSEGVTLHNMC